MHYKSYKYKPHVFLSFFLPVTNSIQTFIVF